MRRLIIFLLIISSPLLSFGALLKLISGSEESQNDFAIVTLQFDQTVPYTVSEFEGGKALELSIPDCKLSLDAREHLSTLRNDIISAASFNAAEDTLHLKFKFSERMKAVVWETNNPFVLVLDISYTENHAKNTSTITEKPPVKQQKSESKKKPISIPAGSKSTHSKVAKEKEPKPGKPAHSTTSQKNPQNKRQQNQAKQDISAEKHFFQGLSLVESGKLPEALKHFKAARKDQDYIYKATVEIASIYHQLGRMDDEVKEWETLLSALEVRGYSPEFELLSRNASSDDEVHAESESSGLPTHVDSQAKVVGSRGLLFYLMLGAVLLLSVAFVWLLKLVYKLREQLSIHNLRTELDSEPEPEVKPEEDLSTNDPSLSDDNPPQETLTTQEEKTLHEESTSEETAMEVISLSEQGFSIQEIAEKLGLGQDEVRLILNLQREEKEYTEKS